MRSCDTIATALAVIEPTVRHSSAGHVGVFDNKFGGFDLLTDVRSPALVRVHRDGDIVLVTRFDRDRFIPTTASFSNATPAVVVAVALAFLHQHLKATPQMGVPG